jgi:hypothetical protein
MTDNFHEAMEEIWTQVETAALLEDRGLARQIFRDFVAAHHVDMWGVVELAASMRWAMKSDRTSDGILFSVAYDVAEFLAKRQIAHQMSIRKLMQMMWKLEKEHDEALDIECELNPVERSWKSDADDEEADQRFAAVVRWQIVHGAVRSSCSLGILEHVHAWEVHIPGPKGRMSLHRVLRPGWSGPLVDVYALTYGTLSDIGSVGRTIPQAQSLSRPSLKYDIRKYRVSKPLAEALVDTCKSHVGSLANPLSPKEEVRIAYNLITDELRNYRYTLVPRDQIGIYPLNASDPVWFFESPRGLLFAEGLLHGSTAIEFWTTDFGSAVEWYRSHPNQTLMACEDLQLFEDRARHPVQRIHVAYWFEDWKIWTWMKDKREIEP